MAEQPSQNTTPSMQIQSWQIWHVYSMYLPSPVANLHQAAINLVSSELADAAMVSDGKSFWRKADGTLAIGETSVNVSGRGTRGIIRLPDDPPPSAFALEGFYVGGYMRYGERHAFGDESPVPYVRAVLGECRLEKDGHASTFYPVLKLYETGVMLLEFRMFSPASGTSLERLINDFENIGLEDFDRAYAPPTVAELAPLAQADWRGAGIIRRATLALAASLHRAAVRERTTVSSEGDFSFPCCELPLAKGSRETLSGLGLTIASVVGYIVSGARRGLPLILRGQRPLVSIGKWSGRPHVYLLRFDGQEESATVNESRFGDAFGAVLARVPSVGSRFMESNLRQFDDYGVYMNRAVRLWVYTPKSLEPPPGLRGDPNFGHVVYLQQVVAELLEYAYALHIRLVETSHDPLSNPREIARLRVLLAELPSTIDRHVHFGEIRDLLAYGYKQMGIAQMQQEISVLLAAKNDLASYEESERTGRWSTLLTIIFGLLAVPSVATDILTPIWKVTNWWKPSDEDIAKVFFVGVASAFVTLFLFLVRAWLFRTRE